MKHVYNIIKDEPDERDYKFSNFISQNPLPSKVSLRDKFPFVFNQEDLGSCGLNSGIMNVLFLLGFKTPILSRLYAYYKVREMEGTINEDSGVQLRDVCKVFQKFGACEESLYPYVTKNFKNVPTPEMDENAQKYKITSFHRANNLTEVKQALALGYPVLIGMSVFEEMESEEVARSGKVPMPKNPNNVLGGHAVLLVSYEDFVQLCKFMKFINKILGSQTSEGEVENLNSWGEEWGDKGFFKFSYEYFEKYVNDAWVLVLDEVK